MQDGKGLQTPPQAYLCIPRVKILEAYHSLLKTENAVERCIESQSLRVASFIELKASLLKELRSRSGYSGKINGSTNNKSRA
jgi:hypothetical protein